MTEMIDTSYFLALQDARPESLCRNGRCSYHVDSKQYSLHVWNDRYLIDPANGKIEHPDVFGTPPHAFFDLFTIYYLLSTKDIQLTGEWISEKDIPGGTTFFRGPHLIPTNLITNRFENDLSQFKNQCENLGGIPVEMADAAFRFSITPDIPVAVLYWIGDEDFSPEAKILYDGSVTDILTLDIVFALAAGVCNRLGEIEDAKGDSVSFPAEPGY